MHKLITIFAVILLFGLKAFAGIPDANLHNKCLYPTVMISNGSTYGTAVIVRSEKVTGKQYKNVFLTSAHVVEENKVFKVHFFMYRNWSNIIGKKIMPCTMYAINEDADLAVGVFYSSREMPTAEIDLSPKLYIGNELSRIGCGLGDEPRLSEGKVTAIGGVYIGRYYIRTSIHTVPGDSGAPVFHENKVVGIMRSVRVYNGGHYRNLPVFGISMAVPLRELDNWSNHTNDALDFCWDDSKDLPQMPFYKLKMENYILTKLER